METDDHEALVCVMWRNRIESRMQQNRCMLTRDTDVGDTHIFLP